jgi:hypothetical protein
MLPAVACLSFTSVTGTAKQIINDEQFLAEIGIKILEDNTLASNSQPSKPCCHSTGR